MPKLLQVDASFCLFFPSTLEGELEGAGDLIGEGLTDLLFFQCPIIGCVVSGVFVLSHAPFMRFLLRRYLILVRLLICMRG